MSRPPAARTTVKEWCDTWLEGYGHQPVIDRAAGGVHLAQSWPLRRDAARRGRPSHVKRGRRAQGGGPADSYVYALHSRLSQCSPTPFTTASCPQVPCSRRTCPGLGKQRPYVATTEQVWALYDALPETAAGDPARRLRRPAGRRGLRAARTDVDFMRGVITPAVQYPAEPLKTEGSRPIPIPRALAVAAANVAGWAGETIARRRWGQPARPVDDRERHSRRANRGAGPARRLPLSTTYGTTSPRCSSPAGLT